MAKDDFKLDFVGIGFPKCGTTWVADVIAQHPGVDFSYEKETAFFDDHDFVYMLTPDEIEKRRKVSPKNLEQYKKLFRNNNKKRGEFTTTYAYSLNALKKIREHNDQIKVIVCTRDTVSASFSKYLHDIKYKPGSKASKEEYFEVIKKEPEFYNLFNYKAYIKNIKKLFDSKNIFFIEMEEIKNNPEKVWQALLDFLGLPEHSFTDIKSSKSNVQSSIRTFPGIRMILKLSSALDSLPLNRKLVSMLRLPGRLLFMQATDLRLTSAERQKAGTLLESNLE